MLILLLLQILPLNAIISAPHEKEVVYRMAHDAAKIVDYEMDRKAEEISSKIYDILHPFQKRQFNTDIKKGVKEHLYEKFGKPIMQEIPYRISDTIHEGTDYIATTIHKLPPGYKLSKQQIDNFSVNVSRTMAERTSYNVKNHVNGKWEEYKRINAEQARRDNPDLVKRDGMLNKRDIFDKIRDRFSFFQNKPAWVPVVVQLVFMLFIFGVFLPEMTIAAGIWGTILQFGVITPVINKLFLDYYFFSDAGSAVGQRVPQINPKPLTEAPSDVASFSGQQSF